jgi:hypothetical protein
MGTSISHRSPSTLNWRAAAATYTASNIAVERTVEEVWKAVISQPNSRLIQDLASPIVVRCLQIALEARSPEEAGAQTGEEIALSGQSSIASDIARRAAVQSLVTPGDKIQNFVESIFTQAADYLVSRDVSGYIGQGERLMNISGSIELKRAIKKEVKDVVKRVPRPEKAEGDPAVWERFVTNLAFKLAGTKQ